MGGNGVVSIVLDADASQVSHARRFVRRLLADTVPTQIANDLQLAASELFTNAIEHSSTTTVAIEVESTPEYAGVSVVSAGSAPTVGPAVDWRVAAADSIDGRGLGIVRQLADELIVDRDGDHFSVTVRRTLTPSTSRG